MQSIKRSILLLKDADGRYAPPGGSGVLRMSSVSGGVYFSLSAGCLKRGDYSLYIFLKDGSSRHAGDFSGGSLDASIGGVRLEDITDAAVVRGAGTDRRLCLKSAGADRYAISERFKVTEGHLNDAPKRNSTPAQEKQIPRVEIPPPEAETRQAQPASEMVINEKPDIEEMPEEPALFDAEQAGEGCAACPHVMQRSSINPFPCVFPNSEWVKISYPGPAGWWHYISGKIYKGSSVTASVLGVPGEYGMAPPKWLDGFCTYLRCATGDAKGYWLMFQNAETGEVLDMGLSPHGG